MSTGSKPHSIEFKESNFEEVVTYLNSNSHIKQIKIDNPSKGLSKVMLNKMKKIGFIEYRKSGPYKLFFCGYGVVGKGWGFLYSESIENELKVPFFIDERTDLQMVEHIKGNWYRFAI